MYSTATSFAAMYRSINDAAIDSYVVDTLLDPSQRIGAAQACMRTDNSIGSRPSALVNPPLAEPAIAQRKYLVAALSAYGVAIAAPAGRASNAETAIALSDLNRAVFQLTRAANTHAQGDLFIDDPAASLATAADHLRAARSRNDVRRIVLDAGPTVTKLLAILRSDVVQRHNEANEAARADYARWLEYYEAVRGRSTAPRPIPRCFAPATAPTIANDVQNDGSNFPGRAAILARVNAARARYDAVRSFDPMPVLDALSALNDAAAGDGVQAALSRFLDAAQRLAKASAHLSG